MASFYGLYSIITHILHVFTMRTSIIMNTHFLSISPYDQLLGQHSMKMSSNCPCFLLQLAFLECFLSITSSLTTSFSRVSLSSIHILWIESLVHILEAWDRVHFRARSRVSGRLRACLFCFQIRFVKVVGDGIRSRALRDYSPKNWRIITPSHHGLTLTPT